MSDSACRTQRRLIEAAGIMVLLVLACLGGCNRTDEELLYGPGGRKEYGSRQDRVANRAMTEAKQNWKMPPVYTLPPVAQQKLDENGFVVLADYPTYDIERYFRMKPNFITADAVLYVFGCFFRGGLHNYEKEQLLSAMRDLVKAGLVAAREDFRYRKPDKKLAEAARRNLLFFGVAAELLRQKAPKEVRREARDIARKVRQGGPPGYYPDEDFTIYKVRGSYTRDDDLENYFRVMKWLSRQILPIVPGNADTPGEADIKLRQAVLLGKLLQGDDQLREKWEYLYDEIGFLVGRPDSFTPLELVEVADRLLTADYDQGSEPQLGTAAALDALRQEFAKDIYPSSAIVPIPQRAPSDAPGKYVQFMGERYTVDGQIMQETTFPYVVGRILPKGLDVAATLFDTGRAFEHLGEEMDRYPGLQEQLDSLRRKFREVGADSYDSVFEGWIGAVREVLHLPQGEVPQFMKTEAWQDKSLNTALASWAQLRHDFTLYGKQPVTPASAGLDALVEPVPELYRRLEKISRDLDQKGFAGFGEFGRLCKNLRVVAEAQLSGLSVESLVRDQLDDDYGFYITSFGQWLLSHFRWVVDLDQEQPCLVVDIATDSNTEQVLHAATGPLYPIVAKWAPPGQSDAQYYFGFVMSYHEFALSSFQRMTDQEWQRLVLRGEHHQHQPEWVESFWYRQ